MKMHRKKGRDSLLDDEELEDEFSEDGDDLDLDGLGKDDDLFKEDLGFDDLGMGNVSTPMDKHSDLLRGLTSFNSYLKDTVNGWLGLTWNEESHSYVKDPKIPPLMNVYCASWCVSFLKTYTRGNNIITNIDENDYKFLVEDIIEAVWLNIGTRAEDFGITNDGDILRICTEMEHAAQLVLMGAGDGKYNQFLSTVTQRNENVSGGANINLNPYPVPRVKQGFFGKLKSTLLGSKNNMGRLD